MGRRTLSREAFVEARDAYVPKTGPATRKAEQRARETGKLNPLVDPAGYGVIRPSRPRFEQREDGLWELTVGIPVPIETRVDTTGSMGDNVDIALEALPHVVDLLPEVLPGCDPQIAVGIFGDVQDRFVLCRPQFEMEARKIVQQLTLMVPERDGGDFPEDPHYGLFGAAYLTAAWLHRFGLKSYDFTVSDATARDLLDERELRRVFGDDVFKKTKENGHRIDPSELPTTREVVQDLLRQAHAFFLQVPDRHGECLRETASFWTPVFGKKRIVRIPSTKYLPHVQAVIIGLTEGTLGLNDVTAFLERHQVPNRERKAIADAVIYVPLGAQAALPKFNERPKKGDLFRNKTDLAPIPPEELETMQKNGAAQKQTSEEPPDTEWL